VYTPSILIYADTKFGKTTAVYRALNPVATGWIVGEPGALDGCIDPDLNPWRDGSGKPAKPVWSIECLSAVKPSLQMINAAQQAIALMRSGKIGALVFDGLTSYLLREITYVVEVEKTAENYGKAAKLVARRFRQFMLPILEACSVNAVPFVTIAHKNKGPMTIEDTFTPGAADTPNQLLREVPAMFSTVIRLDVRSGKRIVCCDPLDIRYITGDRFNVVKDGEEADLKAIIGRMIKKVREAQ
jgi:hypothetical protein